MPKIENRPVVSGREIGAAAGTKNDIRRTHGGWIKLVGQPLRVRDGSVTFVSKKVAGKIDRGFTKVDAR